MARPCFITTSTTTFDRVVLGHVSAFPVGVFALRLAEIHASPYRGAVVALAEKASTFASNRPRHLAGFTLSTAHADRLTVVELSHEGVHLLGFTIAAAHADRLTIVELPYDDVL